MYMFLISSRIQQTPRHTFDGRVWSQNDLTHDVHKKRDLLLQVTVAFKDVPNFQDPRFGRILLERWIYLLQVQVQEALYLVLGSI